MVEVSAVSLNEDPASGKVDQAALEAALLTGEAALTMAMSETHRHLFANAQLFVTTAQLAQMQAVIAAVEEAVKLPGWLHDTPLSPPSVPVRSLGVFYGYDFHLNEQGVHLIEINTNAGGAFLNALLLESQRDVPLSGVAPLAISGDSAAKHSTLEQQFLAMFRNEWHLERGDTPLKVVAIVDEQPQTQYLYPEFLLAQKMFERAGMVAHIVDPAELHTDEDGLYLAGRRVDLVYNRLTDFSLQHHPRIRLAWEKQQLVLTPNPTHYRRYADKRKLVRLSDEQWLRHARVSPDSIAVLLRGVPQTKHVNAEDADQWWAERKQWFFKPVNGFASKGSYRGANLTKRVFSEIMDGNYVAQQLTPPGECVASVGGEPQTLKYDVRCYVYDGAIQLLAARLYQGQVTNLRTPGGGFAAVRRLS